MQDNRAFMFTATAAAIGALICVIPLLTAAMKPRSEEKDHYTEHVSSRAVGRARYMAGYVGPAFAASVIFQLATAYGLYLAGAAVLTEPISFGLL
ncbi:MAG: hypothetical protein FWF69_00300 [Firmicutes bacterium]|nr:hypothetical protein [Bacillota bacterium]